MRTFNDSKFARRCDATGEGMNEGFCIQDGLHYFKYEKDALKHVKEEGFESLDEAYDEEYYYWTEWDELDEDHYYLADGTLIKTK